MKSRLFSLAIAFAFLLPLFFTYGLTPLVKTSTAAPTPTENAPFKGKILLVNLSFKQTVFLEHVHVRKLGDRSFLVGKGSHENDPSSWGNGKMIWVPVDSVETIVEFESVEELKKASEKNQKRKKEKEKATVLGVKGNSR